MRRVRVRAGAVVLVASMLASCGQDSTPTASEGDDQNPRASWSSVERQPVDVAPNSLFTTELGSSVAVVDLQWALDPEDPELDAVAVMDADGSWHVPPRPAPARSSQISWAGEALVLVGSHDGSMVVQTLEPGADRWSRTVVGAGQVTDSTDWSIWGGSDLAAAVSTSLGLFVIRPDGDTEVVDQPPPPLVSARCVAGDQLLALGSMPGSLHALSLAGTSADWVELAPPPEALDAAFWLNCGPEGPLFIADGEEHRWTGERWASAPIDPGFVESLGGLKVSSSAHSGESSFFVGAGEPVLVERTAPGRWRSLEQPATDVVGQAGPIYVLDANENTVTPLRGG